MYWNRDVLEREGVPIQPKSWDEFFVLSPMITKRDRSSNILQATVALGEYRNITHAKDILAALMLQAGNPIVGVQGVEKKLTSQLLEEFGFTIRPAESALRFYTEFSNPIKSVYSWNRALSPSRQLFLADQLAFYFGYASEFEELKRANPNLNFDVAPIPQGAGATTRRTFGQFYGLAIPLAAQNRGGGFAAAQTIGLPQYASLLAGALQLAPVERSLIAAGSNNAFTSVIYGAALSARGWLDPTPTDTAGILQTMVEDIVSNRARVSKAVTDAVNRITLSF